MPPVSLRVQLGGCASWSDPELTAGPGRAAQETRHWPPVEKVILPMSGSHARRCQGENIYHHPRQWVNNGHKFMAPGSKQNHRGAFWGQVMPGTYSQRANVKPLPNARDQTGANVVRTKGKYLDVDIDCNF